MAIQHELITAGDVHIPHNWAYANAAARTGATGFAIADLGKVARQADDNSYWTLTATTPTWTVFGGLAPTISLANATNVPAGQVSGVIPIPNLASGTPDGTKFVRDDGTLAVPITGVIG